MSGYYPYLLCGLPDLDFDMDLSGFSHSEIQAQVLELLCERDKALLSLFWSFGTHKKAVNDYLALQDKEDEEKAAYFLENPLPKYQREFFSKSLSMLVFGKEEDELENEEMPKGEELKAGLVRLLDEAFYQTVLKSGNLFMRQWFAFDGVLKNTLVAFAARKQGRSPENEFVVQASAPLIDWIKENLGEGDFGLKHRLAYAEEMFAAIQKTDVYERERAIDRFRWNMAEEICAGKDFQTDKVLCYMLQADMLLRWQKMNVEAGRQYLKEVVSEMRKVNLQGEPA